MPFLLTTEESGLLHTLHPSFIRASITSVNMLARTEHPRATFWDGYQGGRGSPGAISRMAGPKKQGKTPGLCPLPTIRWGCKVVRLYL